jgi:hypothetical protein
MAARVERGPATRGVDAGRQRKSEVVGRCDLVVLVAAPAPEIFCVVDGAREPGPGGYLNE